jgi:hypothetical protein
VLWNATARIASVFVAMAFTCLSCQATLGQQPKEPAAQPASAPAQSDSTRLPDAPGTANAPTASQAGGAAQPANAPTSWSEPPAPRYWSNTDPNAQVTVLEDTLLRVMTNAPFSTRDIREGKSLTFTLSEDVVVDDVLIIPRGATLHGIVVQLKKAGKLTGSPDLILQLVSLDLGGRRYRIYTYQFKIVGVSKSKPTETKVKGGAVIGAIAGLALDGSAKGTTTAAGELAGMGTGAALGAGVGTAVALASPGPVIDVPAESQIDFYLASPISVVPASKREAERLSEGLYAGGPVLYVRGETP